MTARYSSTPDSSSLDGSSALSPAKQPVQPATATRPHALAPADLRAPVRRPAGMAATPPQVAAPIKPSAAMLALGAEAGGVSVEVAWRVYRAMIDASA